MSEVNFDGGLTRRFLLWTFGLAWAMQLGAAVLLHRGHVIVGQGLIALMMFVPLLGVLLARKSLALPLWKLRFKGNGKALLAAWFAPALLTAAGAALYFLIFPSHLDMSGAYMRASLGEAAFSQLEALGLSYPLYILISTIGAISFAPLINMLLAVGEEIGWRGFLYPQLKAKFGRRKAWILGGIIWGCWHWPLIWLIGYEYGTDYFGFPVVGMLLFCIFTISAGILCDYLCEKSGSIWPAAIWHGAINAAATIPAAICLADSGTLRLIGLLSGLPTILCAAVLFAKTDKRGKK